MRVGPGDRVPRLEDDPLLRGAARYVADLRLEGADLAVAHAVFVRSHNASARIERIDTAAAEAAPGVVCVARAGEYGLPADAPLPKMVPGLMRPLLAHDVVRHVGEPLAVVVAETLAAATDAAELVDVQLSALPRVVSPYDAHAAGAPLVHEMLDANVYLRGAKVTDGCAAAFAGAANTVHGEWVSQRVAPTPMEPNGVLAIPDLGTGGVTLWASSQFVHGARREVAEALGLPLALVRVVIAQVGGGFGAKFETAPEYVAVAAFARSLRRPVRWQETRSESLVAMPHGRGHHQRATMAFDPDANLVAVQARVLTDAGAYPTAGAGSPVGTGVLMVPGPYRVADVDIEVATIATNTPPVGVYRGPGRAEPNYLRERLLDVAARELGVDPVALRRRNLLGAEQMPFTSATGMEYDTGDYVAILDSAVAVAGYDALRVEQQHRRDTHDTHELGIGVACWLDVTPRNRVGEYASLCIVPAEDGEVRVEVLAGTCDHGQGHESSWALVLSGLLGVPFESVHLVPADTDVVPRGDGTGSARSLQLVASSLTTAGHTVLTQMRAIAAHLLEASAADIVIDHAGTISVAGAPSRTLRWHDVARAAQQPHQLPAEVAALVPDARLGAASDDDQLGPTYPFGVHVAVVDVDCETGAVRLERFVAVDDCGVVVNPTVVEGQQHGGIAQGIGQALFERAAFDDDGTPLATNFITYPIASAAELPRFEVSTMGGPTPRNVIGAKGIGQGGAIGAPAAVVNAVIDALSARGVRQFDMPIDPEQVWRALRAVERDE